MAFDPRRGSEVLNAELVTAGIIVVSSLPGVNNENILIHFTCINIPIKLALRVELGTLVFIAMVPAVRLHGGYSSTLTAVPRRHYHVFEWRVLSLVYIKGGDGHSLICSYSMVYQCIQSRKMEKSSVPNDEIWLRPLKPVYHISSRLRTSPWCLVFVLSPGANLEVLMCCCASQFYYFGEHKSPVRSKRLQ